MAMSFSRADPTSPASVAEASFPTSRRGFHPDEVRSLLREVAAELGRLQERERFLERELRTAQSRPPMDASQIDDETVARVLGEETLRVLQTARESASQIKIKAEEGAARVLREAAEDANRLRNEAEIDAARRRNEANAAAEAELALAKQQGREMVSEARAYRERVLSELTRRREAARQQIEQLVHGRERLLQVFERARLVAVDVVSELEPIGEPEEPEEYVDLTPTTGPVPMMVPPSALPRALSPDEPEAAEASERVEDAPVAEDAPVEDAPAEGVEAEDQTNVFSLFPGEQTTDADPQDQVDVQADSTEPATPELSQLFARLRAETELPETELSETEAVTETELSETEAASETELSETEAASETELSETELPETIFQVRDAALVPLIVSAARRLKRVLADEQNEVLDSLRNLAQVSSLDDLLPESAEHASRYVAAIADELIGAHAAGFAMASDTSAPGIADLTAVEILVGDSLIQPLRNRLERSVSDGAGEPDQVARKVRAVYREWKTQHIGDQLDDVLRLAHGLGVLAGAAAGAPLCWMVDPAGPACPDAEDNSLAGSVPAGEPYPTGHSVAPAHAGCRCLLSRAAK
jgi:DivIVA domain-containing protein